ncbi:protein TAR1-like [Senna tora]|uniref:Protein TAR1-like n=1 Tax=Senna tora TaxID=362788 RepID=A0A834VY66_9FABA|nr:protein TAR1-like [Senna tora]
MREPRYPLPRVIFISFRHGPGQEPSPVRRGHTRKFHFLGATSAGFLLGLPEAIVSTRAPSGDSGRRTPLVYHLGSVSTNSRVVPFVATTMILPQVHLRKPCYDFSFL